MKYTDYSEKYHNAGNDFKDQKNAAETLLKEFIEKFKSELDFPDGYWKGFAGEANYPYIVVDDFDDFYERLKADKLNVTQKSVDSAMSFDKQSGRFGINLRLLLTSTLWQARYFSIKAEVDLEGILFLNNKQTLLDNCMTDYEQLFQDCFINDKAVLIGFK